MPAFSLATETDIAVVLQLMPEFYAEERLPYDERAAARALRQLFADPSAGAVYLIEADGVVNGYMALGFNFSLEFHGRYAWIDELYVREPFRSRGIGTAALRFVEALCRERGFEAVRLEVVRSNAGAGRLYRRAGYQDEDRDLLTRWIR